MDNDDNDYQGHGLHLASEESSKISPVLHPYALPKFDFDEGHLRFDSLVENEVFLGIPSQEDNQWIEDFSRGSSGIEFSSSAADSCSIPRHNVWSEATSSESVEMLLKSVGQEEIVAGESTVKESDTGDVLPSLTEPMDHNLRQDDVADEVKDHNSDLPPAEFLGSFTSLDQNPQAGSVQSNYASQSQEVDLSAYGYSSGIGEKGSTGTEENLHVELKFNEVNIEEDHTAAIESLNNKKQEDSSISVVETGSTERSLPNSMMDAAQLNAEDKISNISQESVGYLQEEISKAGDHNVHGNFFAEDDGKSNKITAEDSVTNIHSVIHVASELEDIAKSAIETTNADILESPGLPMEGNVDLSTAEEHSSVVAQISRSRCATGGMENASQSESEILLSGSSASPRGAGDGSSSGQTMGVCNNDSHAFESQLNKETVRGAYTDKKDDYLESSGKVCTDTTVVLTDVSSAVQIESTEHSEHDNDHGGDNAFILQESVAIGSVGAEVATENSKPADAAAEIHNDRPKVADHVLPTEPAVSSDNCIELSAEQAPNDCSENVSLQEKDGRSFASDLDNAPSETAGLYNVGNKIPFSSLGEVAAESLGKTHGSQFDASVGHERASDANTEEVGSHETVDDVPSLHVGGATTDEVINQKEKLELSGAETLNSVDKDGIVAQAPIDASISKDALMKQFSESVAKKGEAEDCTAVVSEDVNQSGDLVESSDKAIHAEQAVAEAYHERSEKTESASVESDPDLSKSDATKATHLPKNEDAIAAKDHGLPSLSGDGISSAVDQSDPGSASIVNAAELSQSATKKQGGKVDGLTANVSRSDGAEGVDNASSTPMPVKGVMEEDRSFTFDVSPVAGLTEGETAKGWQSFSNNEVVKRSTLVERSPSTSGGGQIDPLVQEVSHGSAQKPDNRAVSGGPKVVSERKTRRGSGRSAKENARKHVRETVPVKQTEKGDSSGAFYSPSGTGKLMPVELSNVERSGAKPSGVVSMSVSSLPDLNTSTPPSVLFHQPFTDMQQLQLRAQIFVYGSLIQGVAPDEACMASAFGLSDGGRSTWESAWRTCVERLHGQKSHASSAETPIQSRSGAKASDQTNKQGATQNKIRGSSKSTPAPVVNPMIPLSSPLWNVPTPTCENLPTNNLARGAIVDYQALSPIHAYQTPAMRNFTGHSTSWASQAPFAVPWVASPQSSPFDMSAHFPALPATETVKVTAVKESSASTSSIAKHTSPIPGVGGPNLPPATLMHDTKKAAVSHTPHTVDPKSKKRKKASAGEDLVQPSLPVSQIVSVPATIRNTPFASKGPAPDDLGSAPLLARNQGEFTSVSAGGGQFSTSVAIASASSSAFKSNSDKFVRVVSPISYNDHSKGVNQTVEKRVLLPEDIAKVAEAKLQAEDAAAHASVAVTHCQSVWSELDRRKSSGLASDVEAKLASAAVAIAAATSVAKAAAAAAKVASNAAMQAKQMADEALIFTGTLNPVPNDPIPLPGFMNGMGGATPASILKAGDGNSGSSSIIVAAREASRRRIEAASAASRHAENLDAIVKAAELAADAVSQAGKIVALGEPLPLSKLAEAGPEGYWKVTEKPPGQDVKSNNVTGHTSNNGEEVPIVVEEQLRPSDKEVLTTDHDTSHFPRETSKNSVGGLGSSDERIPASVCRGDKDLRGAKSRRTSDLSKTISVVPESEIGSRSSEYGNVVGTLNDNTIMENCLVEVFKDNGDFGAWFTASVLNLKDGKALVCYTDLESDEGKLQEWVPLEVHGSKPPIIRLAHTTSVMLEGTRKRRRAAAKDKTWSVGDRVDAWMENCWREGVIVEKNNKDESAISVHFPVQGKISVVKVWHLRSTRTWKNGDWIELPSAGPESSSQGDTPQEKRVKVGSTAIEGKGKGKVANNVDISEAGKPEESSLLPLSAADKVFSIGNTKNDKQPETLRTMRSGLQKEGSKVIFGVPKPGKKRKFMEVSKHYTSDRSTKNNVSTDSDKFAKYLMPQGSGARAWKNSSKIDPKEKQVAESKPKAFKSGKPPSVSTRTLPRKENSLVSSVSAPRNADLTDNVARNFTSNDKNDLDEQDPEDFVSSSTVKEGAEPILSSSQAPTSNVPKKMAAPNVKSERVKRVKVAPAGGKSAKVEDKEKSVPEVVEPRRSNRRIQPTSRLLEGLQSSLIISKIPSASHDKSHRNPNKGGSKGNS